MAITVPLNGLAVLVTRPAGPSAMLAAAIDAAGGCATVMPLLAIKGLSELAPADKQKVLDLDLYQHIIFISTNAVEFGEPWINQYWPQLPMGIQWHAIGKATASAMAELDLPVNNAGQLAMNSEELLASEALQNLRNQRVLIVRGIGGREHLAENLKARGASVDYLDCYQRALPAYSAGSLAATLRENNIQAICLNSGETLHNYLALLGEELAAFISVPVVVPSERVAALAREQGLERVVRAKNAGTEATLMALATL